MTTNHAGSDEHYVLKDYVFYALDEWAPPAVVDIMIDSFGLDPNMSVERLREDLAIAQRARETERRRGTVDGEYSHGRLVGWNQCRRHILGDAS